MNPINKKDSKCFKYAAKATLNHKKINKDLKRITEIKVFINKYNWQGIYYPSEKDNLRKIIQ